MQTTQVSEVPVEDVIKSKLGSAQIAYLSGRLIDPRGDNALEYYKAVLSLQPENVDAKAGLQKIIDTLEQRVIKALQERNAPRVVKAWTALQRAAPNHPQLEALRSQLLALSRAMPRKQGSNGAGVPTVAGATTNSPSSPTQPTEAEADIAERELAEAIARELAEQEAAAAAPTPQEPSSEAVAAVAVASNDVDEAATPIDPATTLAPQEKVSADQQPLDFIAQAARLKRVREVPPEYPREAARTGTEGWVQVEFTIAPDGTTRDLQVRDSEPEEIFDQAAVDSVSKWLFEPIQRNGAPVSQRAVLQVRFVLNN